VVIQEDAAISDDECWHSIQVDFSKPDPRSANITRPFNKAGSALRVETLGMAMAARLALQLLRDQLRGVMRRQP
jgi:hypothetical protein